MKQPIYLDYAAATPLLPAVVAAMQPYLTEQFYNPSATYLAAKQVGQAVQAARATVALVLGARPTELIFTAGGTEANNLAINGVMQQFPEGNVVVSAVEHEAVLAPAQQYDCRLIPVTADGMVRLEAVQPLIDDQTVLLSVMYANNEVGSIQPIHKLAGLVATVRRDRAKRGVTTPLYLHTDACQAANYLDLHVASLGVDLMTLNAGKCYGPKQTGALYVKHGVLLQPQVLGGGQERGQRSGTLNVANVVGFATALTAVQADREAESQRLCNLQRYLLDELTKRWPQVTINGSRDHRLPNNIHLTFPGQDNERLIMALDEAGIQAAAGSACSASDDQPSHVLHAMGLTDEQARSSLRLTMGRATTKAQLNQLLVVLGTLV